MTWAAFRGWQKFAFRRGVERQNDARREANGQPPVRRPRMDNDRGPQEPPGAVEGV